MAHQSVGTRVDHPLATIHTDQHGSLEMLVDGHAPGEEGTGGNEKGDAGKVEPDRHGRPAKAMIEADDDVHEDADGDIKEDEDAIKGFRLLLQQLCPAGQKAGVVFEEHCRVHCGE